MKKYLILAALLFSFGAHAEPLPEPSIDNEPRGCNNSTLPCNGWIFGFSKYLDSKGRKHNWTPVYITKSEASNVGDAYTLAVKRAKAFEQ